MSPWLKQLREIPNVWKGRTNIISPDLCDDIIQRLAPSLAQHIGCTIIDINPGVGLWSSKLHNYLKPRNHILIEPKQNIYLPFLQPLLDAPGSRYHLIDWPDKQVWQPQRFVEEGLLHDAEGRGGPPPTTEEPNNSILIIANMIGQRHKIFGEQRATTHAHHKAMDYAHALRLRSGFSMYGPTRLLMWLSDEDKRSILPRTVKYRGKLALILESHVHVEEVVGFSDASDSHARREDALEIESGKRVARRMQENDMIIPPHRQVRMEDRRYNLSDVSRHWHKELQELDEAFRAGKFNQFVETVASDDGDKPRVVSVKRKGRLPGMQQTHTPEYRRMATLRSTASSENHKIAKVNLILKSQEKIDKMNLDLHREDIQPSEKEEIIKALESSIQDYKDELEAVRETLLIRLFHLDDDRRAFAMNPPLLMWDRRKADPLLARENEFYTPKQAALLDFQPKAADEHPLTAEQSIYFDLIATSLLSPSGQTTFQQVKTIAPGALEALVPQVPAIRDPRKGGRYDMESVRVRTATPEMFHGLAVAWDNWVFKPPIESELTRFGNSRQDRELARIGVIVRL